MLFWIGILFAALTAWLATKMGFRDTWLLLFNIAVSVYAAVMLTPTVINTVPATSDTPYGIGLTITATALAAFAILHGISYALVTSQYKIAFPRVFDTVGAGCLGFLGGFLVWSFLGLSLCLTPIAGESLAKKVGFGAQTQQAAVPYLSWWCDSLDMVVGDRDNDSTRRIIAELLQTARDRAANEDLGKASPEAPAASTPPLSPN